MPFSPSSIYFMCCNYCAIGGYSSLMAPQRRRFSHAGTYRKCHSIDASRLSSAYPIDDRFYFIESDGEEADDEFDQITVSADVENRGQHSHLSLPQRVCIPLKSQANQYKCPSKNTHTINQLCHWLI